MKKIFSILFALVLVVHLGLVTAAPVWAGDGWTDIVQVAAGDWHTVGLKEDGTVVAMGYNGEGQCVVGDWTDITQVAASSDSTLGIETGGTVVVVGLQWTDEGGSVVGRWTDIIQVAAGSSHHVGLESSGTVVAVGFNSHGECDVGGWTDITQVAASGVPFEIHTVGLKSDSTVVAVGWNDDGQCNVGAWTDITQIAAGNYHTVGLKSDGTVVAVGGNGYGQCNVGGWTDIIQVAAGYGHTVGLKDDGTVVTVGYNVYGQCNVGGWTGIVQVAAGYGHTVGLKSDGTVVAVGDNEYGQRNFAGGEENGITERVTDGTVDAREEADTEVEVDGTATVTVFPYVENPGGPAPTNFSSLDKYTDVFVPDTTGVTELEIRLYYTDAEVTAAGVSEESLRLFWWDGYSWVQCSDSGVNTASINAYSGYMWAKIRNNTTPRLSDLQGTPFGGYGHPSAAPRPCGCFIATAAYGTDTAKEIDVLREFRDAVFLPNSLGAGFVSLYYKISPSIANFVSQHQFLKAAVRVGFVDPIVAMLNWSHDLWSVKASQ